MSYSRVSFRMILSDLEWLNEICNDTTHRAAFLWQLSFLWSVAIYIYTALTDESDIDLLPSWKASERATVNGGYDDVGVRLHGGLRWRITTRSMSSFLTASQALTSTSYSS